MQVWIEEAQDFRVVPVCRSQMLFWLKEKYPEDTARHRKMKNNQLRATIINIFRKIAKEAVK